MFELAKLSFKACNPWESMFGYVVSKFIMPIINIIIFYNISIITNNNSNEFALRSVLVVMLITIVTDSIIFIQSEKRFNTLTPILITPISTIKLYFSRIIINYILGLILTILYLISIIIFLEIPMSMDQILLCILHLIGLSIPIQMLSMAIGYCSVLVEEVSVVTLLLYNGLLITSGIFTNVNVLFFHWLTPIKLYVININSILQHVKPQPADFIGYFVYLVIYALLFLIFKNYIEKQIAIYGAKEE